VLVFPDLFPGHTFTGAAFAISVGIIALCIVAAAMKKSTQLILFEIHFLQELKSHYWTQFDIGYYSTLGLIVVLNLLFMGTLILMIYGVMTVRTELLCPAMLVCLLVFGVCLGGWVFEFIQSGLLFNDHFMSGHCSACRSVHCMYSAHGHPATRALQHNVGVLRTGHLLTRLFVHTHACLRVH
jgi:hypothetical protein